MEFSIKKSDLVRELSLCQGVIEKRTTIPILSNILIEATQQGVTLTATDLELGIRSNCPAQVKREGVGTIPARRLLDYVRLLPEADIQVKFAENQWVSLTCGRSRTRIAGMSRESYPELPEAPEKIADLPGAKLAAMITETIFAISNEDSRFTLNGALLHIKPDSLTLVSTDGHRLSMVQQPMDFGAVGPYRALLPRKAMSEILRLVAEAPADATVAFSGTDNHLFFQIGDRLLLSRKLTGTFPEYDRVLPREHPHSVLLPRDDFRGTIERVGQFADERSHAVRIHIKPGEMVVHSSLLETGESEETLPVIYDGPEVEIGFNAQYLLDFLRATREDEICFLFRDPGSAGELRPSGENVDYIYRYVIMPMRI